MKNMKKILALALVVMSVLAISIPALAYTETPVSGTRYITASNGLPVNVRKGPGTNYALANVGSFPVGTQVTLQSKATGTDGATWYKVVNSSNAGGWVKGTYLTTDHPSEADWVARYTTFVFVVSNTWREGCANLQTDLNTYFRNRFANTEITYPGYPLTTDGIFGNNSSNATREFQRLEGLAQDGKAGNATKEALYRLTH